MKSGDCVVFAIKVWQEMGRVGTFVHNGGHGALMLQERDRTIVIDSTAKRSFVLWEGQEFVEGDTTWSLSEGLLREKKKDSKVSILSDMRRNVC
jgi:hypothetical protein